MEILKVDPEAPDVHVLLVAAEAVLRGGVIAFPTDTLYGLGCSLFDVSAVEMIARLKRRDPSLAVVSLISDPRQVYGLAAEVSRRAHRAAPRARRRRHGGAAMPQRSAVPCPTRRHRRPGRVEQRQPVRPPS